MNKEETKKLVQAGTHQIHNDCDNLELLRDVIDIPESLGIYKYYSKFNFTNEPVLALKIIKLSEIEEEPKEWLGSEMEYFFIDKDTWLPCSFTKYRLKPKPNFDLEIKAKQNVMNMKITKEIAKEMIKTENKLLTEKALEAWPELGEKALPTCFEEICFKNEKGYYLDSYCGVNEVHGFDYKSPECTNVFLKTEQAEASSILGALITARDIYRDRNEAFNNWIVYLSHSGWTTSEAQNCKDLWSFQDKKTAELFIENFKEQLNIIKNLY